MDGWMGQMDVIKHSIYTKEKFMKSSTEQYNIVLHCIKF
jgi:hypothetical protein